MARSDTRESLENAERGASAVEYGLLVSGIAAVIAIGVYTFGGLMADVSTDNCEQITGAVGSTISSPCK